MKERKKHSQEILGSSIVLGSRSTTALSSEKGEIENPNRGSSESTVYLGNRDEKARKNKQL